MSRFCYEFLKILLPSCSLKTAGRFFCAFYLPNLYNFFQFVLLNILVAGIKYGNNFPYLLTNRQHTPKDETDPFVSSFLPKKNNKNLYIDTYKIGGFHGKHYKSRRYVKR